MMSVVRACCLLRSIRCLEENKRSILQNTDKLEDIGSHTQQLVNRAESLDVNNVANAMW